MSVVTIQVAKEYLSVIGNTRDGLIQRLLNGAEDEALQYLDLDSLDDILVDGSLPGSVELGVLLLVQASWGATPADAEQLRKIAEIKLFPYRRKLGV